MSRIKSKPQLLETMAEVDRTAAKIAELQREQNRLRIERDDRIAAIKSEYEDELQRLGDNIDLLIIPLEEWARANKRTEFQGRKSLELTHAIIGFRTGTPKVKKGRKFKTLQEIAYVMQQLPWAKKYAKVPPPSVDKKALIADRDKLTAEQMNTLGISIVQDESFFVDPKDERLEQGVKS